jgi:hypothetical protein
MTDSTIERGSATHARKPPRPTGGWAGVAPTLGAANAGSPRAPVNSCALAKRSAGSFSKAFATAAATFGGTAFRIFATGCASSVTIFMMICCADEPVCGGSPANIS